MCKVMTRVMTLSTSARHGHDSSHYPRKIQHAQTLEHVVMKPRETCMNAHVEVITLEPLQDMIMKFVSAEDVELTCRCIHL